MRLLTTTFLVVISCFSNSCTPVVTANVEGIDYTNFDGVSVRYFLPKGEISATVSYDSQTDTIKIARDPTPTITADLKAGPRSAVYRHSQLSKDAVTISTDSATGLLTQISTDTTDQSTQIATAVGQIGSSYSSLKTALEGGKSVSFVLPAQPGATSTACPNASLQVTKNLTYWRENDDAPRA
jgi:hypothetical protein